MNRKSKTDFSSVGPSADGRIKPDVSALGNNDVLFSTPGCCYQGSGTSFSCPLVAGLVAGLRQALPQASVKEIYQRVINSASQATQPDNLLGYGIPNFTLAKDLFNFQDEFLLYPNPVKDVLRIIFKDPHDQVFTAMIFNSSGTKGV